MQMAMRGCNIAEEMAIVHQNRPCFKKIDSLCARMKQDLLRTDSVLANINSQGMVWAVKDMIFVFTRVINAWNIMKGYVYNTPEGLNNVKGALSPNFYASFSKWEESTLEFGNNLIESFENVNEMVQSQRLAMQKLNTNVPGKCARQRAGYNSSAKNHVRAPMNSMDEAMKLCTVQSLREKDSETSSVHASQCSGEQSPISKSNFLLNVVKNSEETQRQAVAKGTYMKTGLYNPLKKETFGEYSGPAVVAPPVTKSTNELKSIFTQTTTPISFNTFCDIEEVFTDDGWAEKQDLRNLFVSSNDSFTDYAAEKDMFNQHVQPPIARPLTMKKADPKIEYLLHRLYNLTQAEYFFSAQFTKNYVR